MQSIFGYVAAPAIDKIWLSEEQIFKESQKKSIHSDSEGMKTFGAGTRPCLTVLTAGASNDFFNCSTCLAASLALNGLLIDCVIGDCE